MTPPTFSRAPSALKAFFKRIARARRLALGYKYAAATRLRRHRILLRPAEPDEGGQERGSAPGGDPYLRKSAFIRGCFSPLLPGY